MPSLIGTDVAINYRKQIVPFSRFGTRKISWFRVGHLDTNNGGYDEVVMNIVINTIQTKGEIVTVGAPYISNNWGKFVVGIFEDTFNNGDNTDSYYQNNQMSETLAQAIQNALNAASKPHGTGDVEVEQIYMYGAPWGGTYDNSGWTADNQYQEYATKTEFDNGTYSNL